MFEKEAYTNFTLAELAEWCEQEIQVAKAKPGEPGRLEWECELSLVKAFQGLEWANG